MLSSVLHKSHVPSITETFDCAGGQAVSCYAAVGLLQKCTKRNVVYRAPDAVSNRPSKTSEERRNESYRSLPKIINPKSRSSW